VRRGKAKAANGKQLIQKGTESCTGNPLASTWVMTARKKKSKGFNIGTGGAKETD